MKEDKIFARQPTRKIALAARVHTRFLGKTSAGNGILKERSKGGRNGKSREPPLSSLRPDMSFGTWVTYLFVLTGQPAANQEATIPLLLVSTRDSRSEMSAS